MSATPAFDLALLIPPAGPTNVQDGILVQTLGPPFATQFLPVVKGARSGLTVGNDMPAATAQNQILISGPGPNFTWNLGINPAAAATVPPATAPNHAIISDASSAWQDATIPQLMTLGGAVTASLGGTFAASATLVFTPSAAPATRIDGGDPTLSNLDNFAIDAGAF